MRGVEKAYNSIMKNINTFYSKEEVCKRAKEKLLGMNCPENVYFESEIGTQHGLCLVCACSYFNKEYKFDLKILSINFKYKSIGVTGLCGSYVPYNKLISSIDSHKYYCSNNIVQVYGDLSIGFYTYNNMRYFAGMVGSNLVFLFEIEDYNGVVMNNMFLCNDCIKVIFNNNPFILSLEDYSLKRG